jgi:tRNA threonylcarbamoyladenosine biosynthesis protein TsaE
MIRIRTFSPEETMDLGEKIGRLLKGGEVICLTGDLGAGKTHFTKGVARGLGVSGTVTSPTFTLIHEYSGRLPLYHVDAYRLCDPDEAYDLGLEEYLYGDGVTLVEWPERISELLPPEYMTVEISRADESDENNRDIEITAGPGYEEMLRILAL